MLTLSASRIKLYQSCRATYYDNYVLGNKQSTNTSALMGSALHKAIEYRYKKNKSPHVTFTQYMTRMYDYWHKSGEEFKEYEPFMTLLKTGKDILTAFPWNAFSPIQQELAFELPFTENTRIKGFIDMIDGGGFVDFKSSKKPSDNLQNDIQFVIYAWSYKQLYNDWPMHGEWYHLRTNKPYYFTINPNSIEDKIAQLRMLAERMYMDTFHDVKPCERCTPWCKFKKVDKHASI